MTEPDSDPSVFDEPHFGPEDTKQEEPHSVSGEPVFGATEHESSELGQVEHSVWDEPTTEGSPPPEAVTWSRWYREKVETTTAARSWTAFAISSGLGGPFAILGAFLAIQLGWHGIVFLVLVGPATEEVLKAAAAGYVVERRPYLWKHPWQPLLAVQLSALCFAVIENLMYLHVYIENPSPGLGLWRWTVCTAMHVVASSLTGIGLVRVWTGARDRASKPDLALLAPFILTAVALHAVYNGAAMAAELMFEPS